MKADAEQFRACLDEANRQWDAAILDGRPADLGELVTEDFVYAEKDRAIMTGRAAIVELCKEWVKAGVQDEKLTVIDFGCSGNMGYQLASFSCNFPDGKGGLVPVTGRFVDVFTRQPDGGWLRRMQSVTMD